MKSVMLAASLSKDACNKKLIHTAAQITQDQGVGVDRADFSEFSAPLYHADLQTSIGFPPEITHFVKRLQAADGGVIASPEYSYSIPGTLKNWIEGGSRIHPLPWKGCSILLMSTSPSLVGGNRGLWSTRIPLEACGGLVLANMFSLASAYTAFDEQGRLKDKNLWERLSQTMTEFISYASRLRTFKQGE